MYWTFWETLGLMVANGGYLHHALIVAAMLAVFAFGYIARDMRQSSRCDACYPPIVDQRYPNSGKLCCDEVGECDCLQF